MERREAVLEPDLPIVDPHHHLWDRPATLVAALPQTGHGFEDIIRAVPRYLERFQMAGGELFARREDRALQRHGGAGLSVERRVSGGDASAAAGGSKDGERSQ